MVAALGDRWGSMRKLLIVIAGAVAAVVTAMPVPAGAAAGGQAAGWAGTPASAGRTGVALHYVPNGNWAVSGTYEPGQFGFNLADVGSAWELGYLPAGVSALVWIGACGGVTASFQSQVKPYIGNSKVWGFYLMDEPDPSSCPAANLKAESDWIHASDPGAKTFIIEQDLSASYHPSYAGGYTPANSDIDYFGLDPYPCRNDTYPVRLDGCAYSYITLAVTAAERAGIPQADIVPVFQAFGGGTWAEDGNGRWILPTAAQEQQIMATWARLVPEPVFDYTYSWGLQRSDTTLLDAPVSLQTVFAAHNG
jgi:hypothetical protein